MDREHELRGRQLAAVAGQKGDVDWLLPVPALQRPAIEADTSVIRGLNAARQRDRGQAAGAARHLDPPKRWDRFDINATKRPLPDTTRRSAAAEDYVVLASEGLNEALDQAAAIADVAAADVDARGVFPREAIDCLASNGVLGLISSVEVGGRGEGMRAACVVVEQLARSCASTAMVTLMHYAATAVIEEYGPREVREEIAGGTHLTTLAFSEVGSRSHFWAPLSTARGENSSIVLSARKSWVTSAGEANSYVWSSKPLAADGLSTIWLVPAGAAGLEIAGRFDGLGLRGNDSRPIDATETPVARSSMLGLDGGGFDVMTEIVLPWFQVLNSACSIGIMEAAIAKAVAHVTGARLEHLDQTLADQPETQARLAVMRLQADQARAVLADTLSALEGEREDAPLRVLEVKAVAGEAAIAVTDLAMRVCGGAAFRKDVGVERHFRDARAASVMAPTTDTLHEFIGRVTCGLSPFG